MLLKILMKTQESLEQLKVLKARPRWQVEAERNVRQNVADVFMEVEEEVFNVLQQQGRMPSDPSARAEILEKIYEKEEKFVNASLEGALEGGQRGHNRFVSQLQQEGFSISFGEPSEEIIDEIVNTVQNSAGMLVERFGNNITNILAQGAREGIGMQELTDRLTSKFDFEKRFTAETIARTEVVGNQNKAFFLDLQQNSIQYHMWINAEDSRVRGSSAEDKANHLVLHGEIVEVGTPFSNGLLYPGDRNGPIAEWINCRCTTRVFFVPEGKAVPEGLTRFREGDLMNVTQT